MRVLAFAASLRGASLNRKLIRVAAEMARSAGAEVDLAEFRDFELPIYDGDLDAASGLPPGGAELKRRVDEAAAIMIAAPEYNYSVAGPLKNAIDWVSRARPMPWRGKSVLLMSASPSPMGGIRGLWQTRIPLEGCGALVFPDMFALAHADAAFDDRGALRDAASERRLREQVVGFVRLAHALVPVCGAKGPGASPQERREIAEALEKESALQPPPR